MYVEPGAEAPPHGSLPSTVPILGTKELLGIWRRKLHVPDGGSFWEQCEEHTCMDASFRDLAKFEYAFHLMLEGLFNPDQEGHEEV